MTKQHYKEICSEYDVNPRALKEILKKDGLKIKKIDTLEVLEKIYIYAPDLMYCRSTGEGTVEYQNNDISKQLLRDINKSSKDGDRRGLS